MALNGIWIPIHHSMRNQGKIQRKPSVLRDLRPRSGNNCQALTNLFLFHVGTQTLNLNKFSKDSVSGSGSLRTHMKVRDLLWPGVQDPSHGFHEISSLTFLALRTKDMTGGDRILLDQSLISPPVVGLWSARAIPGLPVSEWLPRGESMTDRSLGANPQGIT